MILLTTAFTAILASLPAPTPAELMLQTAKALSAQITETNDIDVQPQDAQNLTTPELRNTRDIAVLRLRDGGLKKETLIAVQGER